MTGVTSNQGAGPFAWLALKENSLHRIFCSYFYASSNVKSTYEAVAAARPQRDNS